MKFWWKVPLRSLATKTRGGTRHSRFLTWISHE
jgi:hypothetical protein